MATGAISLTVRHRSEHSDLAASKTTMSEWWCVMLLTNLNSSSDCAKSSCISSVHRRMSRQSASGERSGPLLVMPMRRSTETRSDLRRRCSSHSAWYCTLLPLLLSTSDTSGVQRLTMSGIVCASWMPVTTAAHVTFWFLSSSACLMWRSMGAMTLASPTLRSVRIALALSTSLDALMSLTSELLAMKTCSAVPLSSLRNTKSRRRTLGLSHWNSLVAAKKTSVASVGVSV